jgi:predicted nucleotidyltransferase
MKGSQAALPHHGRRLADCNSGAVSGSSFRAPLIDGELSKQALRVDPPYDPSIPDVPIPPDDPVFMDMPVPELPTEGEGTMLIEMTEEHDTGDLNHRPAIDPIADQNTWEGVTLSFTANAVDMDNDALTWSLADAPAGMSIDYNPGMPEKRTSSPSFVWPLKEIEDFCRRWKIIELSVFGSILRQDFRPDSDVDLLVRFAPDAHWSLFDHSRMERELATLLGREVDLVSRSAVERSPNWIRREEILRTARTLYAA